MKLALDSNVVLRYLLNDDPQQADIARKIMQEATLIAIPLPVWCEVVWVLKRGYQLANTDIADAIALLIAVDKVIVQRSAVEAGLTLLRAGGDFADAVIAHEGLALGSEVFVSFDQKAIALLQQHTPLNTQLLS